MESMMYHTTTILLFRPFGSQKQIAGIPASPWELCTASANSIVTLIKLYRSRYSLRYIVNLSVHMIFTASIIHLVNATSSNDSLRRSSNNALRTCTSAFVEIGKVWPSASKSLRVVESLQQKWQIHTSSQPIDDDVSPQNWTNYTYPTLPMKVEPEFDTVMPSFTDGEFADTYHSSQEFLTVARPDGFQYFMPSQQTLLQAGDPQNGFSNSAFWDFLPLVGDPGYEAET